MKRISKLTTILCVCSLSIILNACKANVDLGNIDMTTSVETSLSLPLGSIYLKLGDFLGDSTIQGVSVDENGQYLYADTMQFSHTIELVDINEYTKPISYSLDFAEQIAADYPEFNNVAIPAGKKISLDFPIHISLDKMNEQADEMRLDSLVINMARFFATIQTEDLNLAVSDIQRIELEVKNGFSSASGNIVRLPLNQYGWGQDMPIELRDVHIVLMKDPKQEPSMNNLLDSLYLNVHIQIQTSQQVQIQSTSSFSFTLALDNLAPDAIFGYIKMPSLLQDSVIDYPIEKFWAGWKAFDGTILPVSKPSLLFTIEHGFSVPLAATVNALNVSNKDGEYRHATFNGSKSKIFTIPSKIAMDAPYDATIIDSIRIDYTAENGNIDELLTIHPDNVSYNYAIGIDTSSTQKQFRITNNPNLNMSLGIHIPFEFNSNVYFAYCDTMRDINLTAFQLDSLLAEVEFIEDIEKAELKLYLTIENWIPFNIEAVVTFFDEEGEKIQISSMEEDHLDLMLSQPKTITNGLVSEPSTNQIILNVTKDDFEKIASTDYIVIQAKLKDNDTMVKLTPQAAVVIKAGITADVKAIIDVNGML